MISRKMLISLRKSLKESRKEYRETIPLILSKSIYLYSFLLSFYSIAFLYSYEKLITYSVGFTSTKAKKMRYFKLKKKSLKSKVIRSSEVACKKKSWLRRTVWRRRGNSRMRCKWSCRLRYSRKRTKVRRYIGFRVQRFFMIIRGLKYTRELMSWQIRCLTSSRERSNSRS